MEPKEHADNIAHNLDEAIADLEGNWRLKLGFGSALVGSVGTDGPEVYSDPQGRR